MTSTIHSVIDRDKALRDATAIRLRLLENGYTPLPATDKQVFMKLWNEIEVDEEKVQSWSRDMGSLTTAFRIEGELVGIDVDVDDEEMIEVMRELIYEVMPDVYENAPLRTGKGHKFLLVARCPGEKVGVVRSRKFGDPEGNNHALEIFGGNTSRYFTAWGPHTSGKLTADGLEVKVSYEWDDDVSLLNMTPDMLPVVTRDQLITLSHRATDAMISAGWEPVKKSAAGEVTEERMDDLLPDMRFELDNGTTIPFEELEAHVGHRCSARWQDGLAGHSRSRCLIDYDPHVKIVRILDFDDYVWHYPEGADIRPRKARDGDKQKASSLKLGALLGDKIEGEVSTYASPRSPAVDVTEVNGRSLNEWEFVEWLFARYAYYPGGTTNEEVVDMVTGETLRIAAFNTMWNAKAWEEDTGEEYTRGPRAGEAKVEKIVPTKVWLTSKDRVTLDGFRFTPDRSGKTERLIKDRDGRLFLNSYQPPIVRGDEPPAPDAVAWFNDFIDHLLPDEGEADWFVNWLAYKYQNPGDRGQAVVMVSPTGGSGRGLLFKVVHAVFGEHVARPSANALSSASGQSEFNGWMDKCVLALVDELLVDSAGIKEKERAYEVLKDTIDVSPKAITVNEKGMAKRASRAVYSFLSATNNVNALPLHRNDRRFTVLSNGGRLREGHALLKRYAQLAERDHTPGEGLVAELRTYLDEIDADYGMFVRPLDTPAREEMIGASKGGIEEVIDRVLGKLLSNGTTLIYFEELATKVRTECAASGMSQSAQEAVKHVVRKLTRAGYEGWTFDPRKRFSVGPTSRSNTPAENNANRVMGVVEYGETNADLSWEERAMMLS